MTSRAAVRYESWVHARGVVRLWNKVGRADLTVRVLLVFTSVSSGAVAAHADDGAFRYGSGGEPAVARSATLIGHRFTCREACRRGGGRLQTAFLDYAGGLTTAANGTPGQAFFDLRAGYRGRDERSRGFITAAGFDLSLDRRDRPAVLRYNWSIDREIFHRWHGIVGGKLTHNLRNEDLLLGAQGSALARGGPLQSAGPASYAGYTGVSAFEGFAGGGTGTRASLSVGGRFRITDQWMFGATGELPVTGAQSIGDFRLSLGTLLRF